jgi:hypothetical protein
MAQEAVVEVAMLAAVLDEMAISPSHTGAKTNGYH